MREQWQEQWIEDARNTLGARRRKSAAKRFLGRALLLAVVPFAIGWWLA